MTARLLWLRRPMAAKLASEHLWPLLWDASLRVAEESMRLAGAVEHVSGLNLPAFRHSIAERSMWQAEREGTKAFLKRRTMTSTRRTR